jgi:NAD-dependent SIR2 family protein deacetylase
MFPILANGITVLRQRGLSVFRKNVFILGAGFSANAGAPVMWDFIEHAKQLRDDHRLELPQEDRKTFDRVFQRLGELRVAQAKMDVDIENIEHLFSLLDMDIEFGGVSAGTLRQDLIFLILRTLERTIRTENIQTGTWTLSMKTMNGANYQKNLEANYLEHFSGLASRRWIRGSLGIPEDGTCQDTILTMNYDCLVDDCLVRLGVQPAYGLDSPELPQEFLQKPYKIALLKLHGSANWFRCNSDRCKGRIWVEAGTPSKRLEYFYGKSCSQCRYQVEPVIVPPTWAKGGQSEVLRPVWAKALRVLREAGRIFVIGYSMPPTDQFFKYMLALALATNEKLDKVIVVNPSKQAQETFAKLFHSQFSTRKLVPIESTIDMYKLDLGNELGQYQHGLDEQMIRDSGVAIR